LQAKVKRVFGSDKVGRHGIAKYQHRPDEDLALVNPYLHRKRLILFGVHSEALHRALKVSSRSRTSNHRANSLPSANRSSRTTTLCPAASGFS
jgi:hypothetical protein